MENWLTKRIRKYKGYLIPDSEEKISKEAYDYWNKQDLETKDMSHWKEEGRWEDDKVWNSVGDKHFGMFNDFIKFLNYEGKMETIAEWGPGGAANLSKFSKQFKELYGVDISVPNLKQCNDELVKRGINSFKTVHIGIDAPETALSEIGKGKLDFFLCTAVYQHFPGQNFAHRVTKIAHELLRKDGLTIIQTRYNNGKRNLNNKTANYRHNVLTFTTYYVEEFWTELQSCGFTPYYVILNPETHYAYYFAKRN